MAASHLLHRARRVGARTAVTCCAGGALAASSAAAHAVDFTQITDTPFGFGMFEPTVSVDGQRVAFSAAYDFTGGNTGQNFEIYVHDMRTGTVTQLTDSPVGFGNFMPMITPDGGHVVFLAAYDYTGENPDLLNELFEVDLETLEIRQLTFNPPGVWVLEPAMSGDGMWIAYRMAGNPVGLNGDGSFEIFRVHRLTRQVEQITVTEPIVNQQPSVNGDGSRIVFMSPADFDGSNPNGNIEIWMWDEARGMVPVTATPVSQFSDAPSVDAEGRFVTFRSWYNVAEGMSTGSQEVYVADTLNGTYQQVTTAGSLQHLEPTISPDGAFVAFESQRDPLGLNPDLNRETFRFLVGSGQLEQLTDTTGGVSVASLSDRAKTNYLAVAGDSSSFTYRCEHGLDGSNDGFNLELFHVGAAGVEPVFGDLDGDGEVGVSDLLLLLAAWGACDGDREPCSPDLDDDGLVGVSDLLALMAAWSA